MRKMQDLALAGRCGGRGAVGEAAGFCSAASRDENATLPTLAPRL
jgi:hypothetical protein